jgi:copper chaperone NosL
VKKLVVALAVAALVVAIVVYRGTQLPDEVQPIAWNAEACAHCHMLIGDPAFAAQVITDEGDVLSFDDPGCAARYLREHHGHIHKAWFYDGRGARWLSAADVAFVRVAASPMGSGVMAVHRATPGALSLEDIR